MIVNKINKIEEIIAKKIVNDEVEFFDNYKNVKGATEEKIQAFEKEFGISLSEEFKELYRYKNGSSYPFGLFYPTYNGDCSESFYLLSFDEIRKIKDIYFNKNKMMEECGDFFKREDVASLDKRIKPFISNKRWIPFAQIPSSDLYLLLDYDPTEKGNLGQIIIYVHDPDFVYYVSKDISELLQGTISNLENGLYEELHS